MNQFIAVSFSAGYDGQKRVDVQEQVSEALTSFSVRTVEVIDRSANLLVMSNVSSELNLVRRDKGAFMLNFCAAFIDLHSHRRLSQAELARHWFSGQDFDINPLGAPFVVCGRRHSSQAFRAVIDRYGLGQLFSWQGAGVCAVSSSALVIGRVFRLGLDLDAIGEFSHLGHYLGSATAVSGVKKCGSGQSLTAQNGQLETRVESVSYPDWDYGTGCFDDGSNVLRESVQAHVDAYPECDIELSGGIDSRLMLSAISKPRRRQHTAVTLGSKDSPDVKIAAQIAESSGMRHKIVDINAECNNASPEQLLEKLRIASLRHEHAVNPVDKVALEMARLELGNNPRLSGQNGEIMRGFYYPGQPLHGGYADSQFKRLVQWRLIGNDSVHKEFLNPDFQLRAKSSLTHSAHQLLQQYDSWPVALDRFYLEQRMQRWCGSAVSAVSSQRPILMPFFHPAFVDWSLALPAGEKRGSRAACKLISTLAPELASLPFDSGATPKQLTRTGLNSTAYNTLVLGRKTMRRLFQKIAGKRRHNLGTHSVTSLLEQYGASEILDLDALHSTGIFQATALDKISIGELSTDRATLGFLFAMHYTVAYLKGP